MFFGDFPFQGMGGMGAPQPAEPVDTDEYYNLLGLPKDCTTEQVRKAFKRAAIRCHPDKGGDPEEFKQICQAADVLSDPEKRALYDQYGKKGVENIGGGADPTDIFEMFFGGGGRRQARGPAKGEDAEHRMEFTLGDFYNGATRKVVIKRRVICVECDGKGGPEDAMETCKECGGRGIRVVIRRMGPIVSQQENACHVCRTRGKIMPDAKRCQNCQGRCVVHESKTLEVHLDKGAPDGYRVVFPNEADEMPNTIAGDVVIVCKQQPHEVFTRKGNDLYMEKTVTLVEALTGAAFWIKHLDGGRRFAETKSVIMPNMIMELSGEGMPRHQHIFEHGNIYVKFNIQFPSTLITGEGAAILSKVLPGPVHKPVCDSETTPHLLKPVDPETIRARQRSDKDEDEDMPSGGVQCRQA